MQLSTIVKRSVLTDGIFRIRSSCVIVLYSNQSCMVGNNVDDEGYVPAYPTQDRIQGRFQQHCELMRKRREMAGIYRDHTSHGHCNNRQTVLNL